MSLTVRATRVETHTHTHTKKASRVLDVATVTLYLRPAEIELSCLIESISTINPRIEWKKITSEGPSYVYFERKISGNAPNPRPFHQGGGGLGGVTHAPFLLFPTLTGDLENRAVIREPATLLITNATRSDTARYRCEVTAADDQKSFDEIVIDLVVRGMSGHLHGRRVFYKRILSCPERGKSGSLICRLNDAAC